MLKDFPEEKKQILITIKKAITHLNTIEKMIKENQYCIDIVQQLKAVHGLTHSAMEKTLELHLSSCFKRGMESASEKKKRELIEEIIQVTKISNK